MTKKTVGMYGGKFLPLHTGHVYLITQAACMVDELYVVLSYSKVRDEKLAREGNIKPLPYQLRLRWLSQLTKNMPNVTVIAVEDTAEDDETYDWKKGSDDIKAAIGKPIDIIIGAVPEYEPIFKEQYPQAVYKILEPNREAFPISATKIRQEGVFKNWAFIPNVAKPYFVKTVMIVGTESCGKSTLTRYLATTFNTSYVEEYGRTLTDELGGCENIMTEDDFHRIAYGQKLKEQEGKTTANKVLFIDTEAIVTQYYAKLYQGETYPLIDAIIQKQHYDLWLFLEPDVKWVDDGTRSFGDESIRKKNNELLKGMLKDYGVSYEVIQGNYHERYNQAVHLVKNLMQ